MTAGRYVKKKTRTRAKVGGAVKGLGAFPKELTPVSPHTLY